MSILFMFLGVICLIFEVSRFSVLGNIKLKIMVVIEVISVLVIYRKSIGLI